MQCNRKGSQRHAATVLLRRTSKGRHGPLQAASSTKKMRVRSSAGSDEADAWSQILYSIPLRKILGYWYFQDRQQVSISGATNS
jgi:hypothetical protein